MNRVLKCIERIVQVITVIGAICTIVEAIRLHLCKKELKERAEAYLEQELCDEGNMKSPVRVFSPRIEKMQEVLMKLVYTTTIGVVISIILNLINRERN